MDAFEKIDELLATLAAYREPADNELFIAAYQFAEGAHHGQHRVSGEEYITHPLAIAEILMSFEMDIPTLCAAILHDVVEDTTVSLDEIGKLFGDEVAFLVEGVTKLGKLEFKSKEEQQAENMRKLFLAMGKDVRVILIKLADRLHNMRTLKSLPEHKQKAIAMETLEIFAPIANRLGIYRIKWELEDLALRYLDPEMFQFLVEKVAKKREEREKDINDANALIEEKLNEVHLRAEIVGRPKHFYGIYEKITKKGKDFAEIYDLIGIRILVETVKDCYGVLGIVHTLWRPLPGRFKDYIAMPKPNMYQSLHTTVIGPQGQPLEIQIRTKEMHRIAEHGIAAHWKYKEGNKTDRAVEQNMRWLRQMADMEDASHDSQEFIEGVKLDFFSDEVFVFTPQGDVVDLPYGSTPLDFAYRIHTDIGHRCIGAKVNGRIVSLDHEMQNGDIIEILTTKSGNGPSRDWLKIVKTSQARNKIRQWFKRHNREENIAKGKEMLERELKKAGLESQLVEKHAILNDIAVRMKMAGKDDLLAALGHGGVSIHPVLNRWIEEYNRLHPQDIIPEEIIVRSKKLGKKRAKNGVVVEGEADMLIRFALCCSPLPGDPIRGFVTRGRGVSVHRADCPNLQSEIDKDPERLIYVAWDKDDHGSYKVGIDVEAVDRAGILADIIGVISESKINISTMNVRPLKDGLSLLSFIIEVEDVDQAERLLSKLRRLKSVESARRLLGQA